MPEEPVTLDELERLLLQLMGTSPEALDQQMRSYIKRETLVGGKRVTRQELPELPKDAATTVHRVKVSLMAPSRRSGGGSRFPARCR